MVEYFTKDEVMEVLRGMERECIFNQLMDGKAIVSEIRKRINVLYTIRPVMTSTWKTLGNRKDVVYCGGCGFKTLAYKMSPYCPQCGKKMVNGRRANDKR